MRWLSPPDSVPEERASVRYSSPTLTRKPRRSLISLRMRAAISRCFGASFAERPENHAAARSIDISATSPRCSPSILTASASGLSRCPPQAEQGREDWKRPSSSRSQALSVSFQRRSRFGITPSKGFDVA